MNPSTNRVSKQVMEAFQTNKFQNMRKVNEMKKDFYPDMDKRKPATTSEEKGDDGL